MKFFIVPFLCLYVSSLYAADRFNNNWSVAIDGGLPHLIGFEASFIGLHYLEVGIGYGSLPLNRFIGDSIDVTPVAIDDQYSVRPTTSFKLTAPTFFLRYFPAGSGIYFQAAYSKWKLGTTISGDLLDSNTENVVLNSALSGNVKIDFSNISLMLGYQGEITDGFFLSGALGVAFLLKPETSVAIGGQFSLVQAFLDDSQVQDYENAKDDIQNDLTNELNDLVDQMPIVPVIYISFGRTF